MQTQPSAAAAKRQMTMSSQCTLRRAISPVSVLSVVLLCGWVNLSSAHASSITAPPVSHLYDFAYLMSEKIHCGEMSKKNIPNNFNPQKEKSIEAVINLKHEASYNFYNTLPI